MGYSRCLLNLSFSAGFLAFALSPLYARDANRLADPCRGMVESCPEGDDECLDSHCDSGALSCPAGRLGPPRARGEELFLHYSFDRFLGLNRASIGRSLPRTRLGEPILAEIDRIERTAGAVFEGYLLKVRKVKGEPAMCPEGLGPALELWVGAAPDGPRRKAIRGWLPPNFLARHPGWNLPRLKRWRSRGREDAPRIRLRGYLLYNNLKAAEVAAGIRPTAWEISPVTEILFCPSTWKCGLADADGWLELDTL